MASDKALFTVTTKMERADYKKFLYFASFQKSPSSILIILAFSLGGALFGAYYGEMFTVAKVLIFWVLISGLAFTAVCFRIEQKISQREYQEKRDAFNIVDHLEFHDKYIRIEESGRKDAVKVDYDKFKKVIEAKEYFYLYHSEKNASMIRKEDVDPAVDLRGFFSRKFGARFKARKN